VTKEGMFVAPAYPVTNLVDPTGAGDSFAGALIGWLARSGDLTLSGMKSALVRGAAVASFTVEGFSVDRLRGISGQDVEQRVRELKALVAFE
jgi:sugar/nucleoside kinase (ribokinase family)